MQCDRTMLLTLHWEILFHCTNSFSIRWSFIKTRKSSWDGCTPPPRSWTDTWIGDTPCPDLWWGVPLSWPGTWTEGTPVLTWDGGVPHPDLDRGYSIPPIGGTPRPDLGWGTTPFAGQGTTPPPPVGVNRLKKLPSVILRMQAVIPAV